MLNKMLNLVRLKFIVFVQFYLFVLCSSLHLNDKCIVNRSNENGMCKFINDCPRILAEIREQSQYPTICGFQNTQQIICCPNMIAPNQIEMQQISTSNRISAESAYAKNLIVLILS